MKLLTIELGLADLAYFLETMQGEIYAKYGGPERRKVITIGGSYPGAMSAWFRYKYPHVTDGSLSSSGVIKPILDFNKFDHQINKSMALTPGCLEIAGNWVKYIHDELTSNDIDRINVIHTIFGAGPNYLAADFMNYINGTFVEHVQYGTRVEMCDFFVSLKDKSLKEQLEALAKYGGEAGPDGISSVQSTKIDFANSGRQWNYQICTQVGWLFTPSVGSLLVTELNNLPYWIDYCKRAFGVQMNPEQGIKEINMLFGDIRMRGSNIYFTNGIEDGWQWAGKQEITQKPSDLTSMTAHVVDCPNCGHCVDLYTEKDSDAEDLKRTRKEIREHIKKWIDVSGWPESSIDTINAPQNMYLVNKMNMSSYSSQDRFNFHDNEALSLVIE